MLTHSVFSIFFYMWWGKLLCKSTVLFNFSIIMHVARVCWERTFLHCWPKPSVLWAWSVWFHGCWCLRLRGGLVLATFSWFRFVLPGLVVAGSSWIEGGVGSSFSSFFFGIGQTSFLCHSFCFFLICMLLIWLWRGLILVCLCVLAQAGWVLWGSIFRGVRLVVSLDSKKYGLWWWFCI
jgi:hypothetical protein